MDAEPFASGAITGIDVTLDARDPEQFGLQVSAGKTLAHLRSIPVPTLVERTVVIAKCRVFPTRLRVSKKG